MIKPGMFISDRYEIIDKVGSGGMADVYKARCHRLNRFVAIKVLKPEYSSDESFVNKFRAEAQSVAGLSHPNIVNVYDVGDDDGLYYIVMELVEGITLKSFIERKGKLSVKESIGIAVQISQGLESAHNNHIVHRDIKPQNIIISREGKVKVTDFGIAKAVTSNTITSNAMGSVHYISPEQARGGYSDERSDIYSLGITLYEMLTGKVPFAGDNTVSVALLQIQGEAAPIRELEPEIPVSVDKIVQKCMQKKPERRYQSVTELISDLKKALANPDGSFVKIAPAVVDDSPTINLTDEEVKDIKKAAKAMPVNDYDEEEEEEKDDSDVDPKLEKAMVIGSIVAGIILFLIIIFFVGKAFGLFSSSKKKPAPSSSPVVSGTPVPSVMPSGQQVTVKNVIGKDIAEAKVLLEEQGFVVSPTYEANNSIPKNQVFEQSVPGGTDAKTGDTIVLKVSTGEGEGVTIPVLSGNTESEAENILKALGLRMKPQYEWNDTVKKGWVIKSSPAAGSKIADNSEVAVYISRGPEDTEVEVPNLSNLTKAQAEARLKEKGLELGTVTEKYSETIAKGKVITAQYSPSQKVKKGTKVGITISLGPEPQKNVKYISKVTLTDNPFDEGGDGNIVLVLTQDGKQTNVYDEWNAYDDFPISITVNGTSKSKGKITMYVDNEEYKSWTVTFTEVAG